jgi:hypothetical protein
VGRKYVIKWEFDIERARQELGEGRAKQLLRKHLGGEFKGPQKQRGAKFLADVTAEPRETDKKTHGRVVVDVPEGVDLPRPPEEVMRYLTTEVEESGFDEDETREMAFRFVPRTEEEGSR